MMQIALASSDPHVESKFEAAVESSYMALPMPKVAEADDFFAWFSQALPDVLVLDAHHDQALSLNIATKLTADYVHVVVVLYTDQLEGLSLPAMRAGVRDLIPDDASVEDIRYILHEAVQHVKLLTPAEPPAQVQQPTGRVISTISAKGGVGKTMVASNLAISLAKAMPNSTVLVDLDLQFGEIATTLGLDPEYSLEHVLPSAANGDTIALKSRLTHHESGLLVLPAPDDPATADSISSEHISQVLQALMQQFPFVVIDTATGLSDATLVALDHTTDPLLVTSLSVPALHGLRKVLDALTMLQTSNPNTKVIINFADTRDGVTRTDVVQTLGISDVVALPTTKRALASINTGVPLALSRPRDAFVKALCPLAKSLVSDDAVAPNAARRSGTKEAQ